MDIGNRIKLARTARNLNQPDLAAKCGWDSQTRISNYERGIREPSLSDIHKLSKALDVDVSWLTFNQGSMDSPQAPGRVMRHSVEEIAEKYGVDRDPNFFGVEVPAEQSVDHLFAKIRKYDVEFSAGHGSNIAEEEGNGFLYFRKDWLERKELTEENLCVVYVKGDSMEPTINNGEVILVDSSEYYTHVENVEDGFIYAINIDGEAMVKRLFKKPGGRIIVRSDSPAPQYQDMTLEHSDLQYLRIIGRAIWHAGDL